MCPTPHYIIIMSWRSVIGERDIMNLASMKGWNVLFIVAMIGVNNPVFGSPITVTKITKGWFNKTTTGITVTAGRLAAGESISVSYTNANGKVTTETGTINQGGWANFTFTPKAGTKINVTDTTEGTTGSVIAAATFDPPNNRVFSDFTVESTSYLDFAGNTFVLGGGFTAIDTSISYDPLSAGFGIEGGAVYDTAITGASGQDTVTLMLSSPASYSLNLAPLWAAAIPGGFTGSLSTPTSLLLAGELMYNGTAIPFTGSFDGTVSFLDDGSTREDGALTLNTRLGTATGQISASAIPVLVPEPHTASILALGLVVLAGLGDGRLRRWRATRQSALSAGQALSGQEA